MKKTLTTIMLVFVCLSAVYSQSFFRTIPVSTYLKDAVVFSPSTGHESDSRTAFSERQRGVVNFVRGIIDVDLGKIARNNDDFQSVKLALSVPSGAVSDFFGNGQAQVLGLTQQVDAKTVFWKSSDALFTGGSLATFNIPSEQKNVEIDITNLVRSMIANGKQGFGFMVQSGNELAFENLLFATTMDANRPQLNAELRIAYTAGSKLVTDRSFSTFPNPVSGHLSINANNYKPTADMFVKITNSLGQVVMIKNLPASTSWPVKLSTSQLVSDSYHVNIYESSKSVWSGSFIKN